MRYSSSHIEQSWRNWHTRTFEGRVREGTGSSPVDCTKRKVASAAFFIFSVYSVARFRHWTWKIREPFYDTNYPMKKWTEIPPPAYSNIKRVERRVRKNMYNQYTTQQICLMNRIRQLWGQHVYWTRFFIISTAADLDDPEPVTQRLLRNPKDFAAWLAPFYGTKAATMFEELFTEHLLIAAELVNAAKKRRNRQGEWRKRALV